MSPDLHAKLDALFSGMYHLSQVSRILAEERCTLLLTQQAAQRYVAVPMHTDLDSRTLIYSIAMPGERTPYKNAYGYDDVRFKPLRLGLGEQMHAIELDEAVAIDLCESLNFKRDWAESAMRGLVNSGFCGPDQRTSSE